MKPNKLQKINLEEQQLHEFISHYLQKTGDNEDKITASEIYKYYKKHAQNLNIQTLPQAKLKQYVNEDEYLDRTGKITGWYDYTIKAHPKNLHENLSHL